MAFAKMLLKRVLLLLVLYQLCRLLFLAFNYSYFHSLTLKGYLLILYGSFRFDMSVVMYMNTLYILMFIIPTPVRLNVYYRLTGKVIFVLSNAVGIAANLIDCAYYPFILRRTNASFFLEFHHDTNLLKSVGAFALTYWYIALLIILFIWLLIKSYDWIKMPEREEYKLPRLLLQIALMPVIFIAWLGFARGSFVPSNRPINISYAGDYISQPNEADLVINTPFSIMMTWGNIKIPEVNYYPTIQQASEYFSPVQSYHRPGPITRKNVVVIILESFSSEFVGALNENKPGYKSYTPFLDSLIHHSLTFQYSYANGRRSIEALPSVMASIPSLTEAYVLTPYSSDRINSLPEVLSKHGYQTSFFHGAHEGSMGFSAFMKMAGVNRTFSKKDYNNDADFDGTWGIYDEPFLQYWANQLDTFQQPFFSALFTVSSHHPFRIPDKDADKFQEGDLPLDRSIRYTDYSLHKFFETASKMPWYKNTVFILSADHCASESYYKEYQNTLGAFSIPIIFFTPDLSLTGLKNAVVQQADIFPTVMDYLGISDTIVSFGSSILQNPDEHFVVNCFSGTYQAFYGDYMLQFDGKKPIAMYRFKEDMQLQNNVLDKYPEIQEGILAKLKAYLQQYSYRIRENKLTP